MADGPRRKPDAAARRRELCDAAIELLGSDGARGLSHPRVDNRAGVPAGTTSAYYRTRKALLIGVAKRLSEIDAQDLTKLSELQTQADERFTGTTGLATMIVLSGQMPFLVRTRARHELIAQAGRDDDLAAELHEVAAHFERMVRLTITAWQAANAELDPGLLDAQNFALLRFIQGAMLDFVRSNTEIADVQRIDDAMCAILEGVAHRHIRGELESSPVGRKP